MTGSIPIRRRTLLAGAAGTAGLLAAGLPRGAVAGNPTGDPTGGQDRPAHYTPNLFIRYRDSLTDLATLSDGRLPTGAVPPPIPFWCSPDILFSPTAGGNAIAGKPTTITARVFNSGLADALDVLVEFFWFNPSLGFTAGTANPIGSRIVTVPDHQHVPVTCPVPWVPFIVNGGHECLVVQCSTPEEGSNGLRFPFDAASDRHVGQRNLHVAPATEAVSLHLQAGNQFRAGTGFALLLTSTIVTGNLTALRQLGVQAAIALVAGALPGTRTNLLQATDATGTDYGIRVTGVTSTGTVQNPYPQDLSAFLAARSGAGVASGRTLTQLELSPGDTAAIDLSGPPTGAGTGRFLVHRFSQAVQGVPVGGYTVVVTPPGW
jgi:hypothetical protein